MKNIPNPKVIMLWLAIVIANATDDREPHAASDFIAPKLF
jgi:hypothetical protein